MTDVPAIPAGGSAAYEPPMPPQNEPTDPPGTLARNSFSQKLGGMRDSVDQRLLATPDDQIKKYWKIANGFIGLLILTNAILRLFLLDFYFKIFIQTLWLLLFGIIFILIELKIPKIDELLKANFDFMYYPGFRAFFLTFIGTLQWWWVFGIIVSVFCFLGAIFNFYVMRTHPAFGHNTQIDTYAPPEPAAAGSVPAGGPYAGAPADGPPVYADEKGYAAPGGGGDQYGNATL